MLQNRTWHPPAPKCGGGAQSTRQSVWPLGTCPPPSWDPPPQWHELDPQNHEADPISATRIAPQRGLRPPRQRVIDPRGVCPDCVLKIPKNASGVGNPSRVAINFSSQCYVRKIAATNLGTNGNNWTQWQTTNPFGTSSWTILAFTPSTSLDRVALTGTEVLPTTGTLDGVGYWGSNTTNHGLRLDTYSISADPIPEPATAWVALSAALAIPLRRRRR